MDLKCGPIRPAKKLLLHTMSGSVMKAWDKHWIAFCADVRKLCHIHPDPFCFFGNKIHTLELCVFLLFRRLEAKQTTSHPNRSIEVEQARPSKSHAVLPCPLRLCPVPYWLLRRCVCICAWLQSQPRALHSIMCSLHLLCFLAISCGGCTGPLMRQFICDNFLKRSFWDDVCCT